MSLSNFDSPQFFSADGHPNFLIETHIFASSGMNGQYTIAGIDEAGRGPLAGPVVAAAVILDPDNIPDGINDSKKLSATRRELLFDQIIASSQVAICQISPSTIDDINILQATFKAMEATLAALQSRPQCVLIDGRDIPRNISIPAHALKGGDHRSLSIAAASIIAKVTRDRMMIRYATFFPEYGFERHKGYGTKLHMERLTKYGPCPIHRQSFAPVANARLNNSAP